MTPANHPRSCRVCAGSGWQPGLDLVLVANGQRTTYSSVEPCLNHWVDDNPFTDIHGLDRVEVISFSEYRRRLLARHRRGDPDAAVELAAWKRADDLFRTEQ